MSSLWTPGGEYAPRSEPEPAPGQPATAGPASATGRPPTDEELAAEAAMVRDQILATPVVDVIANSSLGMFEIAALYLSAGPTKRDEAKLAIDALEALIDGLGPRLGPHERMLRDALAQLQLAYVEMASAAT